MIRPALTIIAAMYITGCGGDSYSEQNLSPESELGGPPQVDIDFINTASKSVDYFVKQTGSADPLFESSTKVATNNNTEMTRHTISWTSPTPLVLDIGIWDTNTKTRQGEL